MTLSHCEACQYFTFSIPETVFKPPLFEEGEYGACVGCPKLPTHIEHRLSPRCLLFTSKEGR